MGIDGDLYDGLVALVAKRMRISPLPENHVDEDRWDWTGDRGLRYDVRVRWHHTYDDGPLVIASGKFVDMTELQRSLLFRFLELTLFGHHLPVIGKREAIGQGPFGDRAVAEELSEFVRMPRPEEIRWYGRESR